MKGAIFFASRYGSTAQYARWISTATGLALFDTERNNLDLTVYDFLVLGSPVIYHRLMFHNWVKRHATEIKSKPTILFSVSGAGEGQKLDDWITKSLPADILSHVRHVALRGRQSPRDLTWFDRIMLIIGGVMNRDRVAGKQEMQGFDFMNKTSIAPIIEMIEALKER